MGDEMIGADIVNLVFAVMELILFFVFLGMIICYLKHNKASLTCNTMICFISVLLLLLTYSVTFIIAIPYTWATSGQALQSRIFDYGDIKVGAIDNFILFMNDIYNTEY